MDQLMNRFYDTSPYEGFDPDPHPDDLQGWGWNHGIFEDAIKAVRPKIIVEVGTWKGATAIRMAEIVKSLGLDTRIICIDTWLGSEEHFLGQGAEERFSLRRTNGFPQLYFTFLGGVVRRGLQDIIIPLATTSTHGAIILDKTNVRPDLIYLDAAHDYRSVQSDLEDYWPLLSDNGILIGDDYIGWGGVTQAANEFAMKNNVPLVGDVGKFVMCKGNALRGTISIVARA